MPYGEVISRSFSIFWRHRYLWLLGALGGGEAVGGGAGSFSNVGNVFNGSSGSGGATGGGGSPAGADVGSQLSGWFTDNLPLLIVLACLFLLFLIAYFFVSCIAAGATVRAAAEHDAERPFDLRLAWQAGRASFLSILGLRLMGLLAVLIALALLALLGLLGFVSAAAGQNAGIAVAVVLGILLTLALIPVAIGLTLALTLATRSIVLEQLRPFAALGRGTRLLFQRLGRVLLLWLIQVVLALALGIVAAIASFVLLIPMAAILGIGYVVDGLEGALTTGAVLLLVYLIATIALNGAAGSYVSTYWTLAFRRLELQSPPVPPVSYASGPVASA